MRALKGRFFGSIYMYTYVFLCYVYVCLKLYRLQLLIHYVHL